MANIAKINVSGFDYNIKDSVAWDHIYKERNPHNITKELLEIERVENKSPNEILELLNSYHVINALGYSPVSQGELDTKLDKEGDSQLVKSVIDFVNGVKINGALIQYDAQTNTITFG